MSLKGRVIAGKYRGKTLEVLFNTATRTTKGRVKEALFSALGVIKERTCLDLFAGSGALGIEALSRGAKKVIFCDHNSATFKVLNKNLEGIHETFDIYNGEYTTLLKTTTKESVDIVFLDPPYSVNPKKVIEEVLSAGVLRPNFIMSVESDNELEIEIKNATIKKYKYGLTHLAIIRGEQ